MEIVRRAMSARHFLAVSLLAVVLSIVSAGGGKALGEPKQKGFSDPVISSITWESPADADATLDDINIGCPSGCNVNCPNSNDGCPSNCNVIVNC